MVARLCLITCTLAAGQTAPGTEWHLVPHLSGGQEFVYTGCFEEETTGDSVQFSRAYRMENRVFVLNASARESEVALFTVIQLRAAKPAHGEKFGQPQSVRLEVVRVSSIGKISSHETGSLTLPLEGPAPIEAGVFVASCGAKVSAGFKWDVREENRPAMVWQVLGSEPVNGTQCVKLLGVQMTDDWEQPRADRTAWRRQETIWMLPNLGIAYQVERIIEVREPARRKPTRKSKTTYTLETRVVYPGPLFEDRRTEILQIVSMNNAFDSLAHDSEKNGPKPFEFLLAKLNSHIASRPATPYRCALAALTHKIEAAKRGELLPGAEPEIVAPVGPRIALGQAAPDFVVPDLMTKESARLRRYFGKPILLVFYSPSSKFGEQILRFVEKEFGDSKKSQISVIGLAMSDDTDRILNQRKGWELTFPILSGQGLRLTYAVEATPKFVVIAEAGFVRGAYVGWGKETPDLLVKELQRWKPAANRN